MKRHGFMIKRETIVKAIAIALRTAPTPDAMLDLRELPVADLAEGAQTARRALECAVKFLKQELQIFSDAFVPYEGQLLVLTRLFIDKDLETLAASIKETARCWFLAASLNEALRGKPDHVVSGLVQEAGRLVAGKPGRLPSALRVAEADLLRRRVIRGKALSSGAITLFALSSPRSVFNGTSFKPAEFTRDFNSDRFIPILSLEEVRSVLGDEADNPRVLANIVVASAADVGMAGENTAKRALLAVERQGGDGDVFLKTLASQIISKEAFECLKTSDYAGFLRLRSKNLLDCAREFTSGS
jgi:hypothetical protein